MRKLIKGWEGPTEHKVCLLRGSTLEAKREGGPNDTENGHLIVYGAYVDGERVSQHHSHLAAQYAAEDVALGLRA